MKKFRILIILVVVIILITLVDGWDAVFSAAKEFIEFCVGVGILLFAAVVIYLAYKAIKSLIIKKK